VAKGVLGKLAEKIAGEAGKAIGENVVDGAKDILGPAAERTTDFLISLLKGDGGTAARIAVSKTIVGVGLVRLTAAEAEQSVPPRRRRVDRAGAGAALSNL
jgi:hypothetical protein